MNGVHDMGGMANLGRLAPTDADPAFYADWQARVLAMVVSGAARSNIDAGRHQRELIPGPDYLAMTYFERWFAGLCAELVERGIVSENELASGKADPAAPMAKPALRPEYVTPVLTGRGSYVRDREEPALFEVGQRVRARVLNPTGHTRLPRYVRGREGVIEQLHGAHVYPDSHAHGRGEDPQYLYGVRFEAHVLWGPEADINSSIRVDIWEPSLDPA
ncbi:nitrile hydratase subunit beta [Caulobacter sp. KR2-114]|uniref:nitrile hydratase subunit beta n=1 Tax=Caulobacter sp. KR2-114 TaxID=3400912 RepID=UPI003C113E29